MPLPLTPTTLVFPPPQEGGVCVWDLRESVALHASALSSALKIASGIRAPSYSTDALSSGFDHHCCRVVSVCGHVVCVSDVGVGVGG